MFEVIARAKLFDVQDEPGPMRHGGYRRLKHVIEEVWLLMGHERAFKGYLREMGKRKSI